MVVTTCSIVVPTFQRRSVAIDSLHQLLPLLGVGDELILVDQTPDHPAEIQAELTKLHHTGRIQWLRLSAPNIPSAMNVGLRQARSEVVLFLDDDIIPDANLVEAHRGAHALADLVAGMVLQPGEMPCRLQSSSEFRFNSDLPAEIDEFMGGNFSVKRSVALALGGFDQNFVGAAYRYEAEFAYRFVAKFGSIRYEPAARIHHLQTAFGGTRSHGHHLNTRSPLHSVGAYYYLLQVRPARWRWKFFLRPLRALRTRYHLRHPWRLPESLLAELRGIALAIQLHRRGAALMPIGTEAAGVPTAETDQVIPSTHSVGNERSTG